MTEREKMIEAINSVQAYGIMSNAFGGDLPVTNEMLADALIAAGIGDVKETQHRTEVTEWALRAVSFRLTRMCYPECPKEWERLMIECEDHWKWQAEQVIAKKQSEKKIAEEKKDE